MTILLQRHSHTLARRLPSTTNTGSSSNRPRYGTVTPTSSSRLAPRSQPFSSDDPNLLDHRQRCPPRRHHQTRLSTRETLSTPSHHIIFRIRHSSRLSTPLLSLFTPPPPQLADHRNSNLASNKPRQPLTRGNPRVIAPLPLLTPACLRLSQSHYHPRLSRRRRSYYSHTHTTSTSTCIQLAYCSILPSFSITLAYAHIDPQLPSLPDRPLPHTSLHTTTPSISPYTQAVER